MRNILFYLIDLILPPRQSDQLVQALTLAQLQSLGGEEALPYHDPFVTALIWELKYHGTSRSKILAGEYLSEHILSAAAEELGVPLLIPVPMHAKRLAERGHNQTELLCLAAIPFLGSAVEYAPKALERVRNTPTQQGLPRAVRLKNVKGSMAAGKAVVAGRVCIVVDDVTTTGATLDEAKRALLRAGARSVQTIALARS